MQSIDLIYVRPFASHQAFEARLHEITSRFCGRVRFEACPRGDLTRFTSERVFLSPTLPNVVIVHDGELIAQSIGDLPARELEVLVGEALAHTSALAPAA